MEEVRIVPYLVMCVPRMLNVPMPALGVAHVKALVCVSLLLVRARYIYIRYMICDIQKNARMFANVA